MTEQNLKPAWLNRTVLGISLASLFSDWSHEIATAIMPAFLASLGASAAWLGLIEGVADGLSSFSKLLSGYYTDKLKRRKPVAVAGYVITAAGTASFAFATSAWHVLLSRSAAWLGRGVRTPIRKALLSGSVSKEAYGRAFGFERMMDTLGAIVGPASAFFLLKAFHNNYSRVFLFTLIPGMIAAFAIAFIVKEKERIPVPHATFGESLKALPAAFKWFLGAVALFGMGDFAHTLLILFAAQKLAAQVGVVEAGTIAVGLYILHNVFYAGFSYIAGWLADRYNKKIILACGYFLGAAMVFCMIALPLNAATLALIFITGGIYVAVEETLEDSFAAELVGKEHHGMAFGVLSTVNGLGDFLSSIIVGLIWTKFGTGIAFSYSLILFVLGGIMVLSLRRETAAI